MGSSRVRMCLASCRLIWFRTAARVVDLPEPVSPVMRKLLSNLERLDPGVCLRRRNHAASFYPVRPGTVNGPKTSGVRRDRRSWDLGVDRHR